MELDSGLSPRPRVLWSLPRPSLRTHNAAWRWSPHGRPGANRCSPATLTTPSSANRNDRLSTARAPRLQYRPDPAVAPELAQGSRRPALVHWCLPSLGRAKTLPNSPPPPPPRHPPFGQWPIPRRHPAPPPHCHTAPAANEARRTTPGHRRAPRATRRACARRLHAAPQSANSKGQHARPGGNFGGNSATKCHSS